MNKTPPGVFIPRLRLPLPYWLILRQPYVYLQQHSQPSDLIFYSPPCLSPQYGIRSLHPLPGLVSKPPSIWIHPISFTGSQPGKVTESEQPSQEALQAVNQPILGFGLQPGLVIVMLPEQTELTTLRPLRAVLTEKETSLPDLASQYGVTIQEIHTYNHLG